MSRSALFARGEYKNSERRAVIRLSATISTMPAIIKPLKARVRACRGAIKRECERGKSDRRRGRASKQSRAG